MSGNAHQHYLLCFALVLAAFFAAAERSFGPFVLDAFFAAFERSEALRFFAADFACFESDFLETVLVGSSFNAFTLALDLF